jgi:glutamate synthase (NADPH/NADH) small chain
LREGILGEHTNVMSGYSPDPLTSKHAWRDIDRTGLPKRAAADRVADFLEIYGPYDEATAREQAARCVQCPEPLCVEGCPLGNRIPEWLALTAEGQFMEAATLLQSTNNLPGICARMCPTDRLCEGHCILDGQAEPVTIGAIGGYEVTVYVSRSLPGGLLVNGISAFKVDKSVVQRRIEVLEKRGVAFQLGVTIGEDVTLGKLREEHDAVFVSVGAPIARPLHLPGEDLQGVSQAMPFIIQHSLSCAAPTPPGEVAGKQVVVIGGGDTAMDCLRTAIRCQASDVLCVYRRDEASMPCSHAEHDDALEEHARFLCQAVPVAILGDEHGRVTGLRLLRTELGAPGADGRPEFKPLPGTEFEIPADWVIPALGFDPLTFPSSSDFADLATGDNGGLLVDDQHMTNVEGVFAGGSVVSGSSMVVNTVRDARRAAVDIDSFLRPGRSAERDPANAKGCGGVCSPGKPDS